MQKDDGFNRPKLSTNRPAERPVRRALPSPSDFTTNLTVLPIVPRSANPKPSIPRNVPSALLHGLPVGNPGITLITPFSQRGGFQTGMVIVPFADTNHIALSKMAVGLRD